MPAPKEQENKPDLFADWLTLKGFSPHPESSTPPICSYRRTFQVAQDINGYIGLILAPNILSFHIVATSADPQKNSLLQDIPIGKSCALRDVTDIYLEELYQQFLKAVHAYFQKMQLAAIELYIEFTEIIHHSSVCDALTS